MPGLIVSGVFRKQTSSDGEQAQGQSGHCGGQQSCEIGAIPAGTTSRPMLALERFECLKGAKQHWPCQVPAIHTFPSSDGPLAILFMFMVKLLERGKTQELSGAFLLVPVL